MMIISLKKKKKKRFIIEWNVVWWCFCLIILTLGNMLMQPSKYESKWEHKKGRKFNRAGAGGYGSWEKVRMRQAFVHHPNYMGRLSWWDLISGTSKIDSLYVCIVFWSLLVSCWLRNCKNPWCEKIRAALLSHTKHDHMKTWFLSVCVYINDFIVWSQRETVIYTKVGATYGQLDNMREEESRKTSQRTIKKLTYKLMDKIVKLIYVKSTL